MIDRRTALEHLAALTAFVAASGPPVVLEPAPVPHSAPDPEPAPTPSDPEWIKGKPGNTSYINLSKTPATPYRLPPLRIDDAYRILDTAKSVDLSGAVFERIIGRNLRRDGVRIWKGDKIHFKYIEVHHTEEPSHGQHHLPEGVAIMEGVTNVTIDELIGSGFRWSQPGYPNGDLLATEGGSSGIVHKMYGKDVSDAVGDFKGDWRVGLLHGVRANRTARGWRKLRIDTLISDQPRDSHLWAGDTLNGKGNPRLPSEVYVDVMVARGAEATLVSTEKTTCTIGTIYTDVPESRWIKRATSGGNVILPAKIFRLGAAPLGLLGRLG